jgi:hypothetical protein
VCDLIVIGLGVGYLTSPGFVLRTKAAIVFSTYKALEILYPIRQSTEIYALA